MVILERLDQGHLYQVAICDFCKKESKFFNAEFEVSFSEWLKTENWVNEMFFEDLLTKEIWLCKDCAFTPFVIE